VRIPATVPGRPFAFSSRGTEIEPFDHGSGFGLDAQFEWESDETWTGSRQHTQTLAVASFYLDQAPVSCTRFAAFLQATSYTPQDDRNFLRLWPNWRAAAQRASTDRAGLPPAANTTPVTSVSLREARAFCSWAGGRLPTIVEWQYAAQAGDDKRIFPWGEDDDTTRRPPPTKGRSSGHPYPSDSSHAKRGINPWGVIDLVGNVWQWLDEERADEHTRFALLKGASHYQIDDVSRWYFPTRVAMPLHAHSKLMLMDDAYERATTIGFRCAYDAASTARPSSQADGSNDGRDSNFMLVFVLLVSAATGLFRYRKTIFKRAEAISHDGHLIRRAMSDDEPCTDSPAAPVAAWPLNDAALEAALGGAPASPAAAPRRASSHQQSTLSCDT
jgi:formylglycine-generating enzyme required for sulfatase activity